MRAVLAFLVVAACRGDDTAAQPPETHDSALEGELGDSVEGMLHASDANGDPLTYRIVTAPARGQITSFDSATGAFRYRSTELIAGADTFTFQVDDGTTEAPAPGSVTITTVPVLFTGHFALTNVTDNGEPCTDLELRIGHATPAGVVAGYVVIDSPPVVCQDIAYYLFNARSAISSVTDSSITFEQLEAQECGDGTARIELAKTETGFSYTETIDAPCLGGAHVIMGNATRRKSAFVVVEPEKTQFGRVFQGDAAVTPVTLRNLGKVPASAVMFSTAGAPYSFEGGSFPGATGTCSTQIGALASCTLTIALDTSTVLHALQRRWSGWYHDGIGPQSSVTEITADVQPRLTKPTAVAAGYNFTCAIDDGKVVCWGAGNAGDASQLSPPVLTTATQVSAGWFHACAIDTGGVHCWGSNQYGQIDVPSLTNPTQVSAGGNHTCALDSTGVHCWGRNGYGECIVPPLTNPRAVSAGAEYTCALDDNGVHCWGRNTEGATTVPALSTPTAISAGTATACALDATGVRCWGVNVAGQATPPPLSTPTAVSAGALSSCAIASGALVCWGFNLNPPAINPTTIAVGDYHGCAIASNALRCWGSLVYP